MAVVLIGCGKREEVLPTPVVKIRPPEPDLATCRGRTVLVPGRLLTERETDDGWRRDRLTLVRLDGCVARLLCRDLAIRKLIGKEEVEMCGKPEDVIVPVPAEAAKQ